MDARVISRAASGDRDAMESLLTEIRPLVLRRCQRLLPFHQDAEEACQDALLQISRKLDTFTGRGSFEGWVSTVATNQARMTYRSLKRRSVEGAGLTPPEVVDPGRTSVIVGTRLDLLEALDQLEQRHGDLVEAFLLRELASLSYEEIVDQVGASIGTVRTRVSRAREFLRAELGR